MELALTTPAEMAERRGDGIEREVSVEFRLLSLERNYEELTLEVSNISGDIESKLPEVTVSLLTDGMEGTRDEILEIRSEMADAMREIRGAKGDMALGRRREIELLARIDQLKSEKQTLREATATLRTANHHLEREKEAGLEQIKLLKDQVETEATQKTELRGQYDALCEEYNKSVNMLEPIFRRMTPTKYDT